MKFKRIPLTTLLFFLMSVVYLGHTKNVYGHDPSNHPPNFYVDCTYGRYDGVHKTNDNQDPRVDTDYSDSSGNGTASASSWFLRYHASGVINGGHRDNRPKDSEMIYGARVDLSASAGSSSCSGSFTPSLTNDMGLNADHAGWSGTVAIELTISGKQDAHYEVPISQLPSGLRYICTKTDVDESKYDTGPQDVRIEVSDTIITDNFPREISAETSYGPAKASAKRTGSVTKFSTSVYAYPTAIDASLSVDFWSRVGGVESQLDKSANASGNLGSAIEPDSIYASFDGEDHGDSCSDFFSVLLVSKVYPFYKVRKTLSLQP